MATKDKSFEELVREATEAPAAHHASLVGTLSKSHEPGKFVLTLQEGGAVTLDISDVKSHAVLGSSVGQTIVRVEVDAERASKLNPQPLPPGFKTQGFTLPSVDTFHTIPVVDIPHTVPWFEHTVAWLDHPGTPPYFDLFQAAGTGSADPIGPNTVAEGIPDPYGGYGQGQFGGVSPFALATPHQAPQGALAQLQSPFGFTIYWFDHKSPWTDKRPIEDGTIPGHPYSDY